MTPIINSLLFGLNKLPVVNRKIDSICTAFHRIHENFSYDEKRNGERWIIESLSRQGLIATCFDVGANQGDWASLVLKDNPKAEIHCFELCPPTYRKLAARFASEPHVILNSTGLSDSTGSVEVQYCPDADGLSSMFEVVCSKNIERITADTVRGIDYCMEREVSQIDFLKIDVEGAEHLVLNGFGELLTPSKVRVIQFEYGMVNIATKFLLRDFHGFLEARGYRVGKLFPSSVRFREYRFQDEDFLGPNYIASSPEVSMLLNKT